MTPLITVSAIMLLAYIITGDMRELRLRIEFALAGAGIDYKPSKPACFIVAAGLFYLTFGVVLER